MIETLLKCCWSIFYRALLADCLRQKSLGAMAKWFERSLVDQRTRYYPHFPLLRIKMTKFGLYMIFVVREKRDRLSPGPNASI